MHSPWEAFVSGHTLVVNSPLALDPVLLAQELEELLATDQFERNLGDVETGNPRFYEVRRSVHSASWRQLVVGHARVHAVLVR